MTYDELKRAVRKRGDTMREFCDTLGVDRSHLFRVMNGERESKPLLARIQTALSRRAA